MEPNKLKSVPSSSCCVGTEQDFSTGGRVTPAPSTRVGGGRVKETNWKNIKLGENNLKKNFG